MAPSNLANLTKSHNIVAAKKKAKREQIKEIVFDDDARWEFLTGFHKRKVQKKEAAKKKAQERDKQERLETRREHRKLLAEQARKNAQAAERACGGVVDEGSDSEWDGIGSTASKGKGRANEEDEEEYEDEEQLATVTVVEEFDPDSIIHGTQPAPKLHNDGDNSVEGPPDSRSRAKTKPANQDAKAKVKTAAKAKDIKYQTGAARKAERQKQRTRKLEKAERAGGKGSRRKGGSRGKR
ncbi:nucleolar protein 12-domain-containing protein [Ganoderma leucocontextum]|nr:nucleolar protein 12-domain-containing protein [Ganoderma leucocontextum]